MNNRTLYFHESLHVYWVYTNDKSNLKYTLAYDRPK